MAITTGTILTLWDSNQKITAVQLLTQHITTDTTYITAITIFGSNPFIKQIKGDLQMFNFKQKMFLMTLGTGMWLFVSTLPVYSQSDEEIHQKIKAGLNSQVRASIQKLYTTFFQQAGLSADIQEKIIDILTEPHKQLEQEAFEAAQSNTVPASGSSDKMNAQQAQQNQELRSVLGNAGLAQLVKYQGTIPGRIIVGIVNAQGGNLNQSQAEQLINVITEAHQQITNHPGNAEKLKSMSSSDAKAAIKQQKAFVNQTVSDQTQNLVTPQQKKILQDVLANI